MPRVTHLRPPSTNTASTERSAYRCIHRPVGVIDDAVRLRREGERLQVEPARAVAHPGVVGRVERHQWSPMHTKFRHSISRTSLRDVRSSHTPAWVRLLLGGPAVAQLGLKCGDPRLRLLTFLLGPLPSPFRPLPRLFRPLQCLAALGQ